MNAWPTALFVLLWSSGAIFSRWGLDHASPFVLLALRFGVALAFLSLLCSTQAPRFDPHPMLALSVLWLGAVISVGATVLLYRLLRAGNLVNVTSLFYLVPGGTALLDWWLLGNRMAPLALLGLGLVVAGLVLVFHARPAR